MCGRHRSESDVLVCGLKKPFLQWTFRLKTRANFISAKIDIPMLVFSHEICSFREWNGKRLQLDFLRLLHFIEREENGKRWNSLFNARVRHLRGETTIFNWWQFLFKRSLADLAFELFNTSPHGEKFVFFPFFFAIVMCLFAVIGCDDFEKRRQKELKQRIILCAVIWRENRNDGISSACRTSAEFIPEIKLLNGWQCDWSHKQWMKNLMTTPHTHPKINIPTYRLYSWPIESIWQVCMPGIGSDVFCRRDSVLSDRRSLCTYRCDSDGCCVWRNPNTRHNCKCHNACPNFDLRTLCMVYPKVGRLFEQPPGGRREIFDENTEKQKATKSGTKSIHFFLAAISARERVSDGKANIFLFI